MLFSESQGFTRQDFERLMIGPVVMKDEIEYYREIRLLEHFEVHYLMAGLSADGSRFRVRNIFYREDGSKSAVVTSTGGWMDLRQRRLIVPPDKLREAVVNLARSEDFEILPGIAK